MHRRMTGFVFQDSYREKLKTLTDEERGILVMALSEYHENGIIPELEQPMAVAFSFITEDIDRIEASYAAKCEANRSNRAKRTKKRGPKPMTIALCRNILRMTADLYELQRTLTKPYQLQRTVTKHRKIK